MPVTLVLGRPEAGGLQVGGHPGLCTEFEAFTFLLHAEYSAKNCGDKQEIEETSSCP
jgi:hypothetical protein